MEKKSPFSAIQKKIESDSILVFPSEIASEYWLRHSTRFRKKVIPKNQFISWDRFKKDNINYFSSNHPVNKMERILFLRSFLKRNIEAEMFSSLIPLRFHAHSQLFAKSLVILLPLLSQLLSSSSLTDQGKKADLLQLFHAYSKFLKANNLFEPSYETFSINSSEKKYQIIFPEVIEDFHKYCDLIASCRNISTIPANSIVSTATPSLTIFDNSVHEGKWLFISLRSLLQSGTLPEDIVVSVCNLEEIESYLETLSALYSVPIQIHKGKPVSSYRAAHLFKSIRECYVDEFSFAAIKSLFSNKALPWKDNKITSSLIAFGIQYNCMSSRGGSGNSIWEASFNKALSGNDGDISMVSQLQRFFRLLVVSIGKINKSVSFSNLKETIRTFFAMLFDIEAWEEEPLGIAQFALSALDDLCVTSERLSECPIIDPFAVFLGYLDEIIYVRKSKERSIPFYPYRVSAGMMPLHHFIINSSQLGMKYIAGDLPYLNELEKAMSENLLLDFSDNFFSLYAISGDNVIITHSMESFLQKNIIPAHFISSGNVTKFPGTQFFNENDPYVTEEELWLTKRASGSAYFTPLQKRGFIHARSSILQPKDPDYSRSVVRDNDLRDFILPKLEHEGVMKLSSTKLELFMSCPFQYMLEKALRLDTQDWDIRLSDPRKFGIIMHTMFERFYCEIIESHNAVLSSDTEAMQKVMAQTAKRMLDDFEKRHPLPIAPVWQEWKDRFCELSEIFVSRECGEYGNARILATEENMTVSLETDNILLEGKIDRISESGNKLSIIDYKKKKGVSQKEVYASEPTSFQIPFYVRLAESMLGKKAERAGYYLIEQGNYSYVLDMRKPGNAEEERQLIDQSIRNLDRTILNVAKRMRAGNFAITDRFDNEKCSLCSLRGICRSKFLLDSTE
jgi:RecB family exonuclease